MRPFEYVLVSSLQQALAVLGENGGDARPLAGGTDLLVDLKHATEVPKVLVDISKVPEFKGIEVDESGLRIGSAVTHSEIMASPLIGEHAPVLAEAAHSIGAVQTRNQGTIGGNLVTCVPSMDTGPALLALDAAVTVTGPDGERQMPLDDFFVGPRRTALEADELLVCIHLPAENLGKPASFQKFGLRKGQALAVVNLAVSVRTDGKGSTLSKTRIALGAVAPTVIRAPEAEAWVDGNQAGEETFAEAGRIAATEAKPIDDFRASADYRRELIEVLTRRALEEAHSAAAA